MKIYQGKKMVCEAKKAVDFLTQSWGWMLHHPQKKEGLWFVFPNNTKPSMWMPLMLTPINMAFVSEDLKVIDFMEAQPMSLDPRTWRLYTPQKPCKYVLELHPENKLSIGDELVLKN